MTESSRPDLPATTLELSFDKFSPRDFERLWLVEREGYKNPKHLGAAGNEATRVVIPSRSPPYKPSTVRLAPPSFARCAALTPSRNDVATRLGHNP